MHSVDAALFMLAAVLTLPQLLPLVLPAVLGMLVSFLTELVTKWHAPRWLKSLTNVVLAAAAGAIATVTYPIASGDWKVDALGYLTTVGMALLASVVTHYSGATAGLQRVTAGFGLGPRHNPYAIDGADEHDELDDEHDEHDVPNLAEPAGPAE